MTLTSRSTRGHNNESSLRVVAPVARDWLNERIFPTRPVPAIGSSEFSP
jgi:hypothetical protein